MAEGKEELNVVEAEEEDDYIIHFKKPFVFERETYTEIDLSGLEDLTASDMIAVDKIMSREGSNVDVMPEVRLQYACYLASRATKLPVEFFTALPTREAVKIKNCVTGFLFGSD